MDDASARHIFEQVERVVGPLFSSFRARLQSLEVVEKADSTLLSEADTAIQHAVLSELSRLDPRATFIAEEAGDFPRAHPGGPLWIVDPIDGTREFLQPSGSEFCTAICYLEEGWPRAAMIHAPELGTDRRPLTVQVLPSGAVLVDGGVAKPSFDGGLTAASLTHSASVPDPPVVALLRKEGVRVKTRTTSQSIDLLRTSLDLRPVAGDALFPFDVFVRERQLVWDGAPGIALALAHGRVARSMHGAELLPLADGFLMDADPTFSSTVVGTEDAIRIYLERSTETGGGKA